MYKHATALVLAFSLAPLAACSNDEQVQKLQTEIDQLKAQIEMLQRTPGPKGDTGMTGAKGDKGDPGKAAMLVAGANREAVGVHTELGCALVEGLGEACYGQGTSPLAYFQTTDCTGPWHELAGIRKLPRAGTMWVGTDGTVYKYGGPAVQITVKSQRSGSGKCEALEAPQETNARPVVEAGKKLPAATLDQLDLEMR